jgi:hypothetical protein
MGLPFSLLMMQLFDFVMDDRPHISVVATQSTEEPKSSYFQARAEADENESQVK